MQCMGVDESDSCGFNTHPLDYSSYLDLRPCVKPDNSTSFTCLTVATPLFYHFQLGLGRLIVYNVVPPDSDSRDYPTPSLRNPSCSAWFGVSAAPLYYC